MRELVPPTNAVAAKMLASALSRCGGFDATLAGAPTSVPTAADAAAVAAEAQAKAATEAAAVDAQVPPAAKIATEAKAASPAMTVPASTTRHGGYSRFELTSAAMSAWVAARGCSSTSSSHDASAGGAVWP